MAEQRPKNRLHSLDVTEVSLVASGDNPLAKVEIWKADPRNPSAETASASDEDMPNTNKPEPSGGATAGPQTGAGDGNALQVSPEVAAVVKGLESEVDELAEQNELLIKILANAGIDLTDPEALVKAAADPEVDDEDLEEFEEEFDDDDGDQAAEYDDDEDEDDEVGKLLKANPALNALVQAQAEKLAKAESVAEQAARIALFERDQRLDVEFAKRAEALGTLGETGQVASLLKRLHGVGDDKLYTDVETILAKAAHEVSQSKLYTETGVSGAGSPIAKGMTFDTGEGLLEEILTKSAGNATGSTPVAKSRERQFLEALEADPQAYDQWDADRFRTLNGGMAR